MFKAILAAFVGVFFVCAQAQEAQNSNSQQAQGVSEPSGDKVLIVVAHPDDEFMMSGTIAMLADSKCDITVVYATSGDAGLDVSGHNLKGPTLAQEREKEVSNALKILGVKNPPVFLHFKDGHIPESRDQLAEKILSLIDKVQPEMVITFGADGVTGHHDHIAVCNAVTAAFDDQKAAACKSLLCFVVSNKRTSDLKKCSTVDYVQNFFEGVSPSSVNLVVDTSKYRQQRIDAFFIHYTQFNQNYRTAWVKFTADCPYEEFVIARMRGKFSSVSSFGDLLDRKL